MPTSFIDHLPKKHKDALRKAKSDLTKAFKKLENKSAVNSFDDYINCFNELKNAKELSYAILHDSQKITTKEVKPVDQPIKQEKLSFASFFKRNTKQPSIKPVEDKETNITPISEMGRYLFFDLQDQMVQAIKKDPRITGIEYHHKLDSPDEKASDEKDSSFAVIYFSNLEQDIEKEEVCLKIPSDRLTDEQYLAQARKIYDQEMQKREQQLVVGRTPERAVTTPKR